MQLSIFNFFLNEWNELYFYLVMYNKWFLLGLDPVKTLYLTNFKANLITRLTMEAFG